MGNAQSGKPIQLTGKAKLAASKFDADEQHVLHKIWQDMSERSNGKGACNASVIEDNLLEVFDLLLRRQMDYNLPINLYFTI
jgi:hypothetical protein